MSHHEQPAVSLRLLIRAGGALDPDDKPGVAALTAAVLDQGTTTRSAEQIATTIDSIGGVIGSGSGTDLSFIQSIVMKDSLDLALDLVSDIARNPAFAPEEVERQRQQMLSGLKVSYDDPEYLAGVVFDRLVYGFHPYGRPDAGTPAVDGRDHPSGSRRLPQELVRTEQRHPGHRRRRFGRRSFCWRGTSVREVGEVREQRESRRSELPPPTRRLVVIDRPGAVQTEIRVGHTGLPRKHPDYLALDLAIKILGGEGGNRLHRVLRSERGLTYGASADTNALKEGGDIVAETDTRSESTGEALRLIVDEMWRLQRQRVSERELGDAQAYLTGSFPLTIETPSAIALQVLNAVFYGLDLEELRDVPRAGQRDYRRRHPARRQRPTCIRIGCRSSSSAMRTSFAKQLAGVGFDQFERIAVNELDLTSADLRRHARGRCRAGSSRSGYRVYGRASPLACRSRPRRRPRLPVEGGIRPASTREEVRALIGRMVTCEGEPEPPAIGSHPPCRVDDNGPRDTRRPRGHSDDDLHPVSRRISRSTRQLPTGKLIQTFNAGRSWVAGRSRCARSAAAARDGNPIERPARHHSTSARPR